MSVEYSLKVSLTPHEHDNPKEPYYWCILCCETEWHQIAFGWECTPQQCFQTALKEYEKLLITQFN